jgi:hypothetical protein
MMRVGRGVCGKDIPGKMQAEIISLEEVSAERLSRGIGKNPDITQWKNIQGYWKKYPYITYGKNIPGKYIQGCRQKYPR